MDGRSYRLNARRVMEAVFAASLLSVLSVVIVGRPHPHQVAEPVAQFSGPAAIPASRARIVQAGGLDATR